MTAHATIDFETYSEAGYEWSDALNKWVPPEGGSATNRGLGPGRRHATGAESVGEAAAPLG